MVHGSADGTTQRYLAPSRGNKALSDVIRTLTGYGLSVFGSRVLVVRGRTSGQPRTTAVNLLRHQAADYLVAARGETQWARNLRAAGSGELRIGRRVRRFSAVELADDTEKAAVLRAYVHRWRFEVGAFFPDVDARTTSAQWLDLAPRYPVFRLAPAR